MVEIRTIDANSWPVYKTLRLRALLDSPDAFGSTHAQESQRPDSHWQDRLAAAASSPFDLPLFAVAGGQAVGMAWAKVDGSDASNVNLYQMWVAPECRGRGAAALLLQHASAWARARGARSLSLGVVPGDTPAMRLYLRHGFVAFGDIEPLREGTLLMSQNMRLNLNA